MIMHEYASERRQQAERTRGLDPRGKRAALHAPAGTSPADMRYSMTSRWITTSTTWRRSASPVVAIPVPPRRPGCPPGLRPLGWRRERGGGFLNGESEDGGRLELWLSLARRASSS